MPTPSGILSTGRQIASEFSEKNVTFMAAGIAYNAFVSLAPLLVLLLLVVSAVGGGLEDRLTAAAESSLPKTIADVVGQVFSQGETATGASVVGLVVLIWGTLKVFRGLDTAFSEIYETDRDNSFVDQVVDGLVVLVALVVAIVAAITVSTVFAAFAGEVPFLGALAPLALLAGLVVTFFPMYYRIPDADLGWRDVLPGTVLAALGWAALQAVFQVYLTFKGGGLGGFFGGVIVVVTWLYFSGLVLLLGAVFNAVVGGHATGASGGVGRGAGKSDAGSESSLAGAELARYLRVLRERLTGRYEGMEPTEPTGEYGEYRRPTGDVEVVERSRRVDDEREWTVTLRWRTAEDDPGRPGGQRRS